MDIPPEKSSRREMNQPPASDEPTSALDTADFAERLEQFEAETRKRKKLGKQIKNLVSVSITIIILGVYFAPSPFINWGIGFLLFTFGIINLCAIAVLNTLFATLSTALVRLTENCRIQAIGPLLARLHDHPSRKDRELIWQAITSSLQRIQPDEADALPRYVRDRFNRRLGSIAREEIDTPECVEFCVAWLKILQEIGNERDSRLVKHFYHSRWSKPAPYPIRDAAQDCLTHIKARLQAQEPSKSLLRASAPEQFAPEMLLRPVAKSNPTAPRELLRPLELDDEPRE